MGISLSTPPPPARASASGHASPRPGLKDHLDRLYATFDAAWLSPDPLEFVRGYEDPDDIEIMGFYAAGLAYGRVGQIIASLERLSLCLGPHPARFVRGFDLLRDGGAFRGFVHRFHGPDDVALLTELLRRALALSGTLGAFFAAGDDPAHPDVGPGLTSFCRRMLDWDDLPRFRHVRRGRLADGASVRFFFSSPENGSACKRLNLYLRWMARTGGGLDFGLWRHLSPSRLVIPLDTHVARIARYLGLSSRTSADWKMALEVTAALKELDPDDPVKYDFAICRLGIHDRCPRKQDPVKCATCPLQPVCVL